METPKELRNFIRGNADSCIAHRQLSCRTHLPQTDGNFSLECELKRIGQEIENDFFPHLTVYIDRLAQQGTIDDKAKPCSFKCGAEGGRQLLRQPGEIGWFVGSLHSTRLDTGKIKKSVDQLEQAQGIPVR